MKIVRILGWALVTSIVSILLILSEKAVAAPDSLVRTAWMIWGGVNFNMFMKAIYG